MTPLLAPDLAEIERALDVLLTRDADARVLAMQSPIRRVWPESLARQGRRFRVAWCPSELEVRERLDEIENHGDESIVVLTPLDEARLGDDVLARFPRARMERTDRWSALSGAFRARDVDPRLHVHKWLADLLLERAPVGGYPPAVGGILDLESAWRAAFSVVLALPDGRPDASALLEWTLLPDGLVRFMDLPVEARNALAARLGDEGGPAAKLIIAATVAGRGADALAIALACGVVFGAPERSQALQEAAVRLEPLVGGNRVEPKAALDLAEAGRRVLRRKVQDDPGFASRIEARATAILADIRAERAAAFSPALHVGLDARFENAGLAILRMLETGSADDLAAAWDVARHVSAHDRAKEHPSRIERLTMAARLLGWLTARPSVSWGTLSKAATAYASDGGFADRARGAIRSGDPVAGLAAAYGRLGERVAARRESENKVFAELLRDWNSEGASGDLPLPVERVLGSLVAPLARHAPVLLLVLDGLSFAVWHVLAETVGKLGWSALTQTQRPGPLVAAAAMPSVTEISRASLLCGALTRGDQAKEKAGFAASGLHPAPRAGRPPVLFHKADLGAGPELEGEVRTALGDPQQRIVGIVHNAVDAQLSGSDQLVLSWSAEGLQQVAALLYAARDAGRIVVVTGDHGHVLEERTVLRAGGSGDRWRSGGAPTRDGEVEMSGGRVLSPDGSKSIVVAWSEGLRFASRRAGYHGGASPQEVLVPIAVLMPIAALGASSVPAGWREATASEPSWWRGANEDISRSVAIASSMPNANGRRRQKQAPSDDLFAGLDQKATVGATTARQVIQVAWLDALFASETYAAQRRLAGRVAPPDESVRGILIALDARGGRMTRAGLAQALETPALRLHGIVSATRRVLNVDQAQVLKEDGDDIILDLPLLQAQFGLGVVS